MLLPTGRRTEGRWLDGSRLQTLLAPQLLWNVGAFQSEAPPGRRNLQQGQTLNAGQLVRFRACELGWTLWKPEEQLDPHRCCSHQQPLMHHLRWKPESLALQRDHGGQTGFINITKIRSRWKMSGYG